MSQWDKLLWRILHLSNDLRFEEIRKVLEYFGFVMDGKSHGGSHRTFRKKDRRPFTIPQKSPVKKAYVKQVRDIVEMELKYEES